MYFLKFLFILFFSFLTFSDIQAQHLRWVNTTSGTGPYDEEARAIAIDSAQNLIVAGHFYSKVDFDPGTDSLYLTSSGGIDLYIAKFSKNKDLIWAKRIGGTNNELVTDIEVDKNGDVIITGTFNSTVDFDPGLGVYNLQALGTSDAYICKLSSSGNFIWAKKFGSTSYDVSFGVKTDNRNNIILTGSFQLTVDFDPDTTVYYLTSKWGADIFVCYLNTNGQLKWAKQFGGHGHQEGLAVCFDTNFNIYVSGRFSDTCDFNPDTSATYQFISFGNDDAFLTKLDSNGVFKWAKRFGGSKREEASHITCDNTGNILISGLIESNSTCNFGSFSISSNDGDEAFVCKTDNDGNVLWGKNFGNTSMYQWARINDITTDQYNNVYTTGYFQSAVDFDPGSSTQYLNSYQSSLDVFISKLDSNGSFISIQQIAGNYNDIAYGIVLDNQSNIYTVGLFFLTTDFNPGSLVTSFNAGLGSAAFLCKLDQCVSYYTGGFNVSACSKYTWSGKTYTKTGNYSEIFTSSYDCDSIVTLHLKILNTTGTTQFITACDKYTFNNKTYYQSKIFQDTIPNSLGCDSIIPFILTIFKSKFKTDSVATCKNYFWRNKVLTSTGVYYDTLKTANNCDSILTLKLTISSPSSSINYFSACDSIFLNGNWYKTSGTYYDTIPNYWGCDSNMTFYLTINPHKSSSSSITSCKTYLWNNILLSSSGVYFDTLQTSSGCDSICTLTLTLIKPDNGVTQNLNTLTSNASGVVYQWLNCNSGFTPVTGAVTNAFTPSQNGSYAVEVTQNDCKDTSSCFSVTKAGTSINLLQHVNVFPNPTNGQVTISSHQFLSSSLTRIIIFDITGHAIKEQTFSLTDEVNIDMPASAGFYTLGIFTNEGILMWKVVKK